MASPSVSNITQLSASDANTWNSGTVGNANASIPSGDLGVSTDGINPPNTCQQFEGSSVGYTSGQKYSAYSPSWTAVDISGDTQAILLHFAGNPGQFNQVSTDADAITIYGFDSGANRAADYMYVELGGSGDKFYRGAANFFPVLLFSSNATSAGSIDDTAIVEIGVAYKAGSTGQYGVQFRIDQIVYINGEVSFDDGDGTTVGTWAAYRALLEPEAATGSVYNAANVQVKPFYGWGFPVLVNAVNFSDSNFTFAFLPIDTDAAFKPPVSGYYSLTIAPTTATATHAYTDGVFAYDSGTYPLDIDATNLTSGTITMTRCSFLNAGAVTIDGAQLTMVACTISSPASCSIANADLDISIQNCTAAIQWTADLVAGSTISTDSDIDITFAGTDLSDINIVLTASNTITFTPTGNGQTYDLSGLTTTGTVTLDNATAFTITVVLPAGTSNTNADPGTITVDSPAVTYTFNSDTASTLIRYFEDGLQTIVDSATGTTLAYEFPDDDPVDVEFVRQGYVPLNRQDIVPTDGGSLDIQMDFDEAYNSGHGLTITSEYDYVRATKVLTINSDQNALDVRSALADVIRTNSSYYNTKLLMVAIPGLTRVDLIDGASITSMATWKGAGMERFDAADSANPTEKWLATKSVGTITGATTHYRQTSSGDSTALTLTNNVVDEAFQYWSDPNHDGSAADGFDYSDYMVIKSFLAGSKQGRVDVLANAGISALSSNLYTVPLSNEAHDYSGSDPGISADITLVAGSTVGGVAFAYEIVDGGTNTGEDIADQLNYNAAANPNTVIPGGTGLRYFELGNMVIHNATAVETERGFREGATPTQVGFYVSRGGVDHPDFTRFQGNNGTYYTPAVTANATGTNLPDDVGGDTRLQIANLTAISASAWQATTAYSVGDVVLRSTGVGTENTAGLFFRCTVAGTSGGSEPTWVISTPGVFGTSGSETTDNTVTWECFAILLYDSDPASTGWSDSYTDGFEFAGGETARIRFAHLNGGTSFELGQTTAAVTSSGFSFDGSLFVSADSVYASNAVDGSSTAVTNIFTADYANDEIDLDADLNFTSLQFFAFYCYELTSSQGMYNFWGGVTAIDTGNYRINNSVVSLYFDETAGFVRQTDTARIFRADGARPALDPTTGGNGVEVNWQLPVYVQAVGSALTGPQAASLSAIETATAGLTYTVANKVDANIHYVNDVEVDGVGSAGDPWGPV